MPSGAVDTGADAKVFISYSRKDMAFVDRLDAALREHGIEPLIDRSEIYAFEPPRAGTSVDARAFFSSLLDVPSPSCAEWTSSERLGA